MSMAPECSHSFDSLLVLAVCLANNKQHRICSNSPVRVGIFAIHFVCSSYDKSYAVKTFLHYREGPLSVYRLYVYFVSLSMHFAYKR